MPRGLEARVASRRHPAVRGTGELAIDGYYSFAGATVVVERWDTAAGAWTELGTATTSSTGDRDHLAGYFGPEMVGACTPPAL